MSQVSYQDILNQFQQSQSSANQANQQRYDELLGELSNLSSRSQASFSEAIQQQQGFGELEKSRIDRSLTQNLANVDQDLVSSGLSNTTIRPSARREEEMQAAFSRQDVDRRVADQRTALQQQGLQSDMDIANMRATAIEGRNDTGPDLGAYASLIAQAASSGGGGPAQGYGDNLSVGQQMWLDGKWPDGSGRSYKMDSLGRMILQNHRTYTVDGVLAGRV